MQILRLTEKNIMAASNLIEAEWGSDHKNSFHEESQEFLNKKAYEAAMMGIFNMDDPMNPELFGLGCVIKDPIDYAVWGITWVVVAPEHQNKGLGSRLMNELELHASKHHNYFPTENCVVLLTTTKPEFYKKLNYSDIAYWNNTHLMQKQLI